MPEQSGNFLSLNREFNPNARFSIGNAVAFADAAGTAPVDGTGGAPSVTITRTVSSPLDGVASYLFTKDAVNRQGEGFSTDIVLQASDATKVFTLKYDYQITTGTYTGYQTGTSFSDLTCWVYDVTNSVMYQVQGYQVDGAVSTTNQYSFQGSWQCPVGCLTARVIWFLGNTSATAFTARFNNISFGREPRQQGTIETPWTLYTMTITGSTSNPTKGVASTDKAYWRRVGDSVQIQYTYISTDATGAAAGSGRYRFSLPPGMSADTTKITAISGSNGGPNVGSANGNGTTPGSFNGQCVLETTTGIAIFVPTGADHVGSAYCPLNGAVTKYSFDATVPIEGWGANGTLGQDSDVRVIGCRYTYGTSASVTSSVFGDVPNTKVYDFGMNATFGTGITFTAYAPVAGLYQMSAGFYTTSTSWTAGNQCYVFAHVNGASLYIVYNKLFDASPTASLNQVGTGGYFWMNAGDRVTGYRTSSTTCTLRADPDNFISIARISGPAQVQAPEVITARYSTNAGQSISNNTVTIIDFEDKSYDDHGCVTTGASWKFTCPRAGRVRVNARATLASNAGWAVGETAYLSIFKTAAEYSRGPYDSPVTATIVVNLAVEDEVDVVAGDTIDIRIFQLSGGSIALDSTSVKNIVSINYVGGITQ